MIMKGQYGPIFEKNVELVLAGAMKILGCNHASLLLIDMAQGTLQIWSAAHEDEKYSVEETSEFLGFVPRGAVVPIAMIGESLILRSYRERQIFETGMISDLVGMLLPPHIQEVFQTFMGKIRFSCVPVIGNYGVEGVLLFSKRGTRPFSFQQRRLQLEYASRLGSIIDGERFSAEIEEIRKNLLNGSMELPYPVRRIIEIEAEAMLTLDGAQTIVVTNKRTEEMFGFTTEELIGSPFEILFDREEAAKKVLECRMKILSDGHMEVKARMRKKSGMHFPALISGVLALDSIRKDAGAVIKIRQVAEENIDTAKEIEQRLARSEKMAFAGEMAAQMAHEIRNPLVSIGAALRVIKEELSDNSQIREEINQIIDEVDRLDIITRDYLTLSRRVSGKVERINVEDVVAEAIRVVSINPLSEGIRIVLNVVNESEIFGDFDALKQVFINLIVNAVEASEKGATIECLINRDAMQRNVEIKVLDRGEGLNGKNIEALFTPFFTTKPKGSGLGLAISKNIVEEMGGSIELKPRKGGGCEAVVKLPLIF